MKKIQGKLIGKINRRYSNLILIISTIFILSSCFVIEKEQIINNEEPIVEVVNTGELLPEINNDPEVIYKTGGIVELETIYQNNSGDLLNTIGGNTGDILNVGNTGDILTETSTGEILNNSNSGNLLLEDMKSIEEQFCISKGGKVVPHKSNDICFLTDDVGLLKCEINIFHQNKCREKNVILDNDIVIGLLNNTNINEKTNTGTMVDSEITSTGIVTKNIEQDIDKNTVTKKSIIKEQQGNSGKYSIIKSSNGITSFVLVDTYGKEIILSNGNINKKIYDFRLMLDKKITLFYTTNDGDKKEEIIDLNNF